MKKLYLSKRLETVAKMVEPTAFLVDIGCDHGFLAIKLVREGIAKKALCTDVNEGPLQRAKEHIKEEKLENQIGTCLSDGLLSADKDMHFTAATICGMGGLMGVKIIYDSDSFFRKMDCFYLQLQSDLEMVRMFLYMYGYEPIHEENVYEDGKYYTVMKVVNKGNKAENFETLDELVLTVKKRLDNLDVKESAGFFFPYYPGQNKAGYNEFLDFMLDKYKTILEGMPENSDRIKDIEKLIDIMNYCKMSY